MEPTVLITGAATRVGAEIARRLAAEGWTVAIHCNGSVEAAETLAAELRRHGRQTRVVMADLAATDAAATVYAVLDGFPPLTALIHNASRFERDCLADFTPEGFATHQRVNLEAPLALTARFAQTLPAGESGDVVCLLDGMRGWSLSGHFLTYSLSRLGLAAAIELLAPELAPRIRINGIALGPTLPGKQDGPHTFDKLAKLTPLKRVSSPAEVCDAVAFLLAAKGMTGQVIDLSGGMAALAFRPVT